MWCLASRVLQRCRHSTLGLRAAKSLHPRHGVRPTCRRRLMVAAGRRSGAFLKEMKQSGKTKQKDETPTVTELRWESPLQIVKYPDPRLRAANANIGCFDYSLKQLAAEMMEIMYQDDGVGLAAPQVGVNVRLMVFNPAGDPEQGEEMVLVNPRILNRGRRRDREMEGCLSFPGINGDVTRPSTVLVKAQDVQGKPIRLNLADPWLARIFQHEYDHLEGVLFHDRMAPEVVDAVRPRLVDLENRFLREHPGTEIQRVA